MAQQRSHQEELESTRLQEVDVCSQYAAGDREQHPASNKWYNIFCPALKLFMKMLPQSMVNVRGVVSVKVEVDPDLLCELGVSFFKKAEEQKEI